LVAFEATTSTVVVSFEANEGGVVAFDNKVGAVVVEFSGNGTFVAFNGRTA